MRDDAAAGHVAALDPGRARFSFKGAAMHTSTTSPTDRRVRERVRVEIPVRVEAPEQAPEAALTHDLSVWGALVLCDSRHEVGDLVDLKLAAREDSQETLRVSGEVVRVLGLDDSGPWSHAFAVEFDEPLSESWGSLLLG
jgi:hypothetical protein